MPRKATTALAAVLVFFGAVPAVLADANNQTDYLPNSRYRLRSHSLPRERHRSPHHNSPSRRVPRSVVASRIKRSFGSN